jgi:hypothetical protein
MAWDFIISGELYFSSEAQIDRWLQTEIHPENYGDDVFPFTKPLKWISFEESLTVKKFKLRWEEFFKREAYPLDFEIEKQETKLVWRGYLDKDTVADLGNEIAGAFRCAGTHGATGELYFIGIGNTIAFQITTNPQKTEIIELTAEVADELVESERTMAIMNWSEKLIQARMKKRKS